MAAKREEEDGYWISWEGWERKQKEFEASLARGRARTRRHRAAVARAAALAPAVAAAANGGNEEEVEENRKEAATAGANAVAATSAGNGDTFAFINHPARTARGPITLSFISDEVLQEVFSFCDFRSIVQVGRTCRRLRKVADQTLDWWTTETLARLPRRSAQCDYEGEWSNKTILRPGWSKEYESRAVLVEGAVQKSEEFATCGEEEDEDVAYHEELARSRLLSTGEVSLKDFLITNDVREEDWWVKIDFRESIDVTALPRYIREFHGWETLQDDDDPDFLLQLDTTPSKGEDTLFILTHHLFCLLRKADRRAVRVSRLHDGFNHVVCSARRTCTSIMFTLYGGGGVGGAGQGNAKFECVFTTRFESIP